MLVTIDFWAVSGWIIGLIGVVIAVYEWIRKLFGDKDKDALRSHLRSIGKHLEMMQANIFETHQAEDIVKSEAGKRVLTTLAFTLAGVRAEVQEALGENLHEPATPLPPTVQTTPPVPPI